MLEDGEEAAEAEGGVHGDQATDQLQVPGGRPGVKAVQDDGAEAGEAGQQHRAYRGHWSYLLSITGLATFDHLFSS